MSCLSRIFLLLLFPCLLAAKPVLVVTTTLISTAVQDLAGDAFEIEVLMPSGSCPGQFDMDPRQAAVVARASLVIRHEMQGFLDRLLLAAGARADRIAAPQGGFTIPGAYLAYCDKVAAELSKAEPALAPVISRRSQLLHARMQALSLELKARARAMERAKVVSARFQSELVAWLGLEVLTSFSPSEDPSPAVLREAIRIGREHGADLVVGNVQNGARVPETIAEALGVSCVMLSNFPVEAAAGAQDALMRSNLELLLSWRQGKGKKP